jgi:glycoside/pentoside/hexuronide:cation symporter, GPH family
LAQPSGAWRAPVWSVWRFAPFRRLLAVYLVNGAASAWPATLVLFYVKDVIGQPQLAGAFLALYFLAAIAGVPAWVAAVERWGPSKAWAWGMVAQSLAFVGVLAIGPGDVWPYAAVCLASGLMLGADLTAPATLLTGVMQQARQASVRAQEGAFTGWWQGATKLNMALAAGVALPLLAWLGYEPGLPDAQGREALVLVYGGMPGVLKGVALCLWWRMWAQRGVE